MRRFFSLFALWLVVGNANLGFATFLVQQMPKEGQSVHYHFELAKAGNDVLDAELVVNSLARTVEGGEPCRWFEFVIRSQDEGKPEVHLVYKVLVAEKEIGPGKSPLNGIKRFWVAGPSLKPQQIDLDFAKSKDAYLFALFLPAPFKNVSLLKESKKIAFQSGELVAESGTKAQESFGNGKIEAKCDYRFWSHEKVPTGLASAIVEFQDLEIPEQPVKTTFKLTLKKIGTNAKTLLPDAN